MPDAELPSPATARRYSLYLRLLENSLREGHTTISSARIAETLGLGAAQVRKDLSPLGGFGRAGVGYPIERLRAAIRGTLGLNRTWNALIVGVGNLARALLRYEGFHNQGFRIGELFDNEPTKIGTQLDGRTVRSLEELPDAIRTRNLELAIVTVPAAAAQAVADVLVEAGIRGIFNFAPAMLRVPRHVHVVHVDLAIQLEQLAFRIRMGDA